MANKLKSNILFIAHSSDFYGADKVLSQVIEALRDTFKVHVVLPGPGEMERRLEKFQDVELYFLPLPRFSLAGKDIIVTMATFFPFYWGFKKLLHRLEPVLVYGNTIRSVLPVAMARRFGCRTLLHFHEHNVSGRAARLIAKRAYRAADRNIFVCRSALESYAVFAPDMNLKSTVIYNGIKPLARADYLIEPLEFHGRQPKLLAIGQLASHKRVGDLLESMPAILLKYPRAMLVVLGEGELRQVLENRLKELGIADSVALPGYVSDIRPWLFSTDIFLAPFEKEACNMAVIEAMAAKKPVVAAIGGGMPELVADGETGCLYPVGDIAQLTEKTLHLADLKDLQEQFGEAANQSVEDNFNLSAQMELIRQEIEKVIGIREV